MDNQTQNPLAAEQIGKLMGRYAVPCIISLLVGALYNIVDQIFIANATYLGSYGNAANDRARHRGHDRRRLLRVCQHRAR